MCRRDCIYASSGDGERHDCNYCLVMIDARHEKTTRLGQITKKIGLPSSHRKIKILMMDMNCPFFEPVKPSRKRQHLSSKPILPKKPREERKAPPEMADKFRELYDRGMSDRAISEKLGVKEYHVYKWRRERKLVSNFAKNHKRIDEERARELYHMEMTDTKMAEILDCSTSAVSQWRDRNGLPAMHPHARIDHKQIRDLYNQGMNDSQISRISGNSTDAIRRWRKRNGLKSNWEVKQE